MRFVIKFGGSSLSTVSKVKKVAKFVSYFHKTKADELVVVASAMGKTTDALLKIAKKADKHPSDKLPNLVCMGEKISANLLALALDGINEENIVLYPEDIRMFAKGDKNCSVLTHIETANILHELEKKKIVIVPGFQAIDECGNLCMLRRGGSDTTAIALASALNAKAVVYTDVSGYFSADPKIFKNSEQIENLNTLSAIELSSCGAKVMESSSLEIASASNVEVEILKSQTNNGTSLFDFPVKFFNVDALSFKNNLYLLKSKDENFPQIIDKLCEKQAKNIYFDHYFNKNAYFFSSVLDNFKPKMLKEINLPAKIQKIKCEMITIVGSGFLSNEKLKSYLYKTCKKLNIFTFKISISATTIKIIVKPNQALTLSKRLHEDMILRRIVAWNYLEIIQH